MSLHEEHQDDKAYKPKKNLYAESKEILRQCKKCGENDYENTF